MREDSQQNSVRFTASLVNLSMVLSLLAALVFRLTDNDGRVRGLELYGWFLVEIILVLGCSWYLRKVANRLDVELMLSPLPLFVAILSVLVEPLSRWQFETGRPFEFAIMYALKNTMLAMAAIGFVKRYQILAIVASLFLVMFCGSLSRGTLVPALVGVYTLGGTVWLALNNWETLRHRLLPSSTERRLPWRSIGLGAIAACLTLASIEASTGTVTRMTRGFFPGSGGSQFSDPYARDGVGDGDMLVAGQDHITSFAPIEDAPFRTADDPSLYDVFDDSYEEPVLNKKQDRAIPLPPNVSKELQQRLANSNQASREFSTLRQSDSQRRSNVADLHTDALFFVSGRVPLHLRMETYDLYDGIRWYSEQKSGHQQADSLKIEEIEGKPWLRTRRISESTNFRQVLEPNAIKVATIDTNVIPAPVNLVGLHIDRVDRISMFEWHQDSILKMNRERLPEAVTISLTSTLVDPDSIGSDHSILGSSRSVHRAVPTLWHMKQIEKLARDWTSDTEPGWPCIEAVVEKLRAEYQHDRNARPPEDCVFSVGHFLLNSHRGEDYQFATAAAILLRSLGYSTRLVSGFYATPEKYDSRTGLTPVHAEDVHFWVEVYLGDRVWQTIEATPGYEVLKPSPGFAEQMLVALKSASVWAIDHIFLLSGLLISLLLSIRRRAELRDCWFQIYDRLIPPVTKREAVLRVARRIERRLSDCGYVRQPGVTPIKWIEQLGLDQVVPGNAWKRFSQLWERSIFATELATKPTTQESLTLCETIRKSLNLKSIRSLNEQRTFLERFSRAPKLRIDPSRPKTISTS